MSRNQFNRRDAIKAIAWGVAPMFGLAGTSSLARAITAARDDANTLEANAVVSVTSGGWRVQVPWSPPTKS